MGRIARRTGSAALLVAALMLAAPPALQAEPPDGGGGGGGGEPTDVGSDYSDLVVALRDVDGVPILEPIEVTDEQGTTIEYCVRPVAREQLAGLTATTVNPVDGTTVYPIPLNKDLPVLGEDDEACDPQPAFAMYVEEAELERLNMARTSDDVIAQKQADVERRLLGTDQPVTLDAAGRLVIDGVVADAGPEHAGMFQSLMLTGTIPGLAAAGYEVGGLAQVGPFGPWELAAVSLGSAASKFVPVTIDAAIYYNRITEVAEPTVPWRDPALTTSGTDEEFVNYRSFSYDRDEVFPGCATWLDVPTLTWRTGRLQELASFAPMPPNVAEDGTLANVAGFALLAADVRSMVFYLHEHEVVVPGFYADPVGVDTCDAQLAALTAPAVSWGGMPAEVVQTEAFPVTASLYNPLDGTALEAARLRVTVDALDPFTDADQVSAVATDGISGPVPFTLDGEGNLIGYWGPEAGFPVPTRYNVPTEFLVSVGAEAPEGAYTVTLELLSPTLEGQPTPTDAAVVTVLPDLVTARWTSVPGYVDQATNAITTAHVFNPTTKPPTAGAVVKLTVIPPVTEDPADAFVATDVTVFSEAAAVAMALQPDGSATGSRPLPDLAAGAAVDVPFYVMIADGAPLGLYELEVEVVAPDAGAPDVEDVYVGPAEEHGEGGEGGNGDGEGEEPPPPATPLVRSAAAVDGELELAAWFLASDPATGSADQLVRYGDAGDLPVIGDWDGNGTSTVGVVRDGTWFLRNAVGGGMADVPSFMFGDPGDVPVVGRWVPGDRSYYPGVIRGTTLYLRTSHTSGMATRVVSFGDPGDVLFVGDWDGDGDDTPGVFRAGRFYLVNSLTSGIADKVVAFGDPGDTPVVGRWAAGDDRHLPGVLRGNTWYLRTSQTSGGADVVFGFGDLRDIPLVGDWNADGRDTVGVAR